MIASNTGKVPTALDARVVSSVETEASRNARQREERRSKKREVKTKAARTAQWIREIEAHEAVPLMRAIAKAEKVSGHRLAIRLDDSLMLCSRGFRLVSRFPTPPAPMMPSFTTYRIGKDLYLERNLLEEGESIKMRLRQVLGRRDLEKNLVYQGLDEWSTLGKICWWGALFPTLWLPWWVIVHVKHEQAYRRAFLPACSPPLKAIPCTP